MKDEIQGSILEGLNPRQKQAVEHGHAPLLVVAGAGSGKTRVIIHRIAHLIRSGVRPGGILALTFTNKAAGEMRERAAALIGEPARMVTLSTFHSFCYRVLRRYADRVGLRQGFSVYDASDQKALVKHCIKKLNLRDTDEAPADKILHLISYAKNFRKDPGALVDSNNPLSRHVGAIAQAYERALIENNAVDFDNLILKVLDMFEQHADVLETYRQRYTHLLVDEYQDTNRVQFLLLQLLAGPHGHVTAVGDQDQSIYRWRGADISNIIDFGSAYPGAAVVPLEQNYRSTQRILNAANSLIRKNRGTHRANLWSELGDGDAPFLHNALDERGEAEFVADEIMHLTGAEGGFKHSEIAILFRTRAQSRVFEETLSLRNIPYQVVGLTGFYQRKEIKDVIAYLKVLANPSDFVSLARAGNTPRRGIGPKSMEKLETLLAAAGADTQTLLDLPEAKELPGKLRDFLKMLGGLRDKLPPATPLPEFIKAALTETGYMKFLDTLDAVESEARRENVNELVSVAVEVERLGETVDLETFLGRISLQSDIDSLREDADTVKLMTLHSAKGLEFPVVFITGAEEGLLPHYSSKDDNEELEEERRLCYVGATRSKQRLYFVCCSSRLLFGSTRGNLPSRFLEDIGAARMQTLEASHRYEDEPGFLDDGEESDGMKNEQCAAAMFAPDNDAKYKCGDFVEHRIWGRGCVVSFKDGEICVAFDHGQGIKRMAVEFAPIRKV